MPPKRKSRLKIIKESVEKQLTLRNLLIAFLVVAAFASARLWFTRSVNKAAPESALVAAPVDDKKIVIVQEVENPPYQMKRHSNGTTSISTCDSTTQEILCEHYAGWALSEDIMMQAVLRTRNAFEFLKMLFMTEDEIKEYSEKDIVFELKDSESAIMLQNTKQFAQNTYQDIVEQLQKAKILRGLRLPRAMEFRREYWEERRIYPAISPPPEFPISPDFPIIYPEISPPEEIPPPVLFARNIHFMGYKISEYSIKILLLFMKKHDLDYPDGDIMSWDDAAKKHTFHTLLNFFVGDFNSDEYLKILKQDVSCFRFSASLPVPGIIVLKEKIPYKALMESRSDHFQLFAYKLNDVDIEIQKESDVTISQNGEYDVFRVTTDTLYLSKGKLKSAAAENEATMDGMVSKFITNLVKHVNKVDKITTKIFSGLLYMAVLLQIYHDVWERSITTKTDIKKEEEGDILFVGPEQKK